MGFNVILGGYMSTKRVAESIDMNLWIPDDVKASIQLTKAILRLFRDDGSRGDRQKARLMWLSESYGESTEVDGHLRCHPGYLEAVLAEAPAHGDEHGRWAPQQVAAGARMWGSAAVETASSAQKEQRISRQLVRLRDPYPEDE